MCADLCLFLFAPGTSRTHWKNKVQEVPANLIAAGYIQLGKFFQDTDGSKHVADPRGHPDYLQSQASKRQTVYKTKPPGTKRQRVANQKVVKVVEVVSDTDVVVPELGEVEDHGQLNLAW